MAEDPENIVLVYLRRMDAGISDLRLGQEEILARIGRLEEGQARIRRDQASDAETVAHLQARVDRLRDDVN